MEHDMREQIHQLMLQKRQQEVAKQEMMANEEAWVRKVSGLNVHVTGTLMCTT